MIMMLMISFVGIDYQENWARSALLGLSASTGQLSDNHDVISLKSFTDVKVRHRDDELWWIMMMMMMMMMIENDVNDDEDDSYDVVDVVFDDANDDDV